MSVISCPSQDGTTHELCKVCRDIQARRPFCGPEISRSRSGVTTRLCYSHAEDLHTLLTSALEEDCKLCGLLLDAIRGHYVLISNRKNVLDDWDYVDDLDDLADEDDGIDSDGCSVPFENEFEDFFYRPETTFDLVHDVRSPIVLDFTFREPRRDELPSRCVDMNVHWTQTGGLTRLSTSTLSLVSQLSGDFSYNSVKSFANAIQDDLVRLCERRDVRNDRNTDSPYSSELSRMWLEECDTNHELCRQRNQQRELLLPTRVINVASGDSVFLVETNIDQTADYVCLSHCWGRSQQFKTERASLSERMSGIQMKRLPSTFQDAITITRNLGIQYLWIDSLCIIQDSAEDWARESAKMGNIYRDAAVTIFAEHADSDDGGCFSSRPGKSSALCRTPMFDNLAALLGKNEGITSPTFVQAKLHHAGGHSLPGRHSIFETIKTLDKRTVPLNSRAWVLQESILSHRALSYDKDEVRWSCPTMKACECIPEGHIRQSWSALDRGDAESIDARELTNAWSTIVHEFSRRSLTYSSDKLPALAGIATEMSRYKNSSYLAGTWKDDLRLNLSCSVFPRSAGAPYRETRRIPNSTTPSWSWAKLEGEVRMLIHYNDLECNSTPNAKSEHLTNLVCEILD